jgi:hypothetical protein
VGIQRSIDDSPGGKESTTTGLFLAGAGTLGLSIAFGLGAEGAFITAVDSYNRHSGLPAFRGTEP